MDHLPPTGGLRSARGFRDFLSLSSQFGLTPSSSYKLVDFLGLGCFFDFDLLALRPAKRGVKGH